MTIDGGRWNWYNEMHEDGICQGIYSYCGQNNDELGLSFILCSEGADNFFMK